MDTYDDEAPAKPGSRTDQLMRIRRHLERRAYTAQDYIDGSHGSHPTYPPLFRATTTDDKVLVSSTRISNLAGLQVMVLTGEVMGDERGPVLIEADGVDGRESDLEKAGRALWRKYNIGAKAALLVEHSVPYADGFAEPVLWKGRLYFEIRNAWRTEVEYEGPLDEPSAAEILLPQQYPAPPVKRELGMGSLVVDGVEAALPPQWSDVVPIVHVRGQWSGTTPYGCSSVEGTMRYDRMADAKWAQINAIDTRQANPKLVASGIPAGKEDEENEFGAFPIFFLPDPEQKMYWLTLPTQGVLTDLQKEIQLIGERASAEFPELRSAMPGANTSGEAWKSRLLGLRTDIAKRRASLTNGIRRMLAFAYSFDEGVSFETAWDWAMRFDLLWPASPKGDGSQKLMALTDATEPNAEGEQVLTPAEARRQAVNEGIVRAV